MPPTPGAHPIRKSDKYIDMCVYRQIDRSRVYIVTTFRIELKQCASSSNKNRLAQIFADQID